jgi:hypothetical protein
MSIRWGGAVGAVCVVSLGRRRGTGRLAGAPKLGRVLVLGAGCWVLAAARATSGGGDCGIRRLCAGLCEG